ETHKTHHGAATRSGVHLRTYLTYSYAACRDSRSIAQLGNSTRHHQGDAPHGTPQAIHQSGNGRSSAGTQMYKGSRSSLHGHGAPHVSHPSPLVHAPALIELPWWKYEYYTPTQTKRQDRRALRDPRHNRHNGQLRAPAAP